MNKSSLQTLHCIQAWLLSCHSHGCTHPPVMAADHLSDFLDPLLDLVTSPQGSVDVTTRDRAMIEEGTHILLFWSNASAVCSVTNVCVCVHVLT